MPLPDPRVPWVCCARIDELAGDLVRLESGSRLPRDGRGRVALGPPRDAEECAALDFVGFESATRTVEILGVFGVPIEERSVRVSTESGTVIVALLRQGLGVGILTRDAEKLFPDLRCVLPELPSITVPIWLATHRELRTSPRIRIVFDLLAEEIGRGGW